MGWIIDKQFDFCYGHRVWSQQLIGEYCESGDNNCKCRMLHGHQGEVHVFLEADDLERGMVTDFKHLGWFKNFLDDHLDHKFILDINDPLFVRILNASPIYHNAPSLENEPAHSLSSLRATQELNTVNTRDIYTRTVQVPGTNMFAGYQLNVSDMSGPEQEFYEGFFLVNFLPTSENLTKWMFEMVKAKMDLINVRTKRVTLNETPKSRADYSVEG